MATPNITRSKQVTVDYVTRFSGYGPIDPKDLRAAIGRTPIWGQEGPTIVHLDGPTDDIVVVRGTYQEVPGDTAITFTPVDDKTNDPDKPTGSLPRLKPTPTLTEPSDNQQKAFDEGRAKAAGEAFALAMENYPGQGIEHYKRCKAARR